MICAYKPGDLCPTCGRETHDDTVVCRQAGAQWRCVECLFEERDKLIVALDRERAARKKAQAELLDLEWRRQHCESVAHYCPTCEEWRQFGHAADCTLAAALKESE